MSEYAGNLPQRGAKRNKRLPERGYRVKAMAAENLFVPLHIKLMSRIVLNGDGAAKCLRAMIKFMILFGQPEDAESFENVYQDFLALAERMPNILRRQVAHVTGSPQGTPEIYRVLELYFESTETQTEALMSPAGQEAGAELARLPSASVQLLFTDVYEEAGGSTAQPTAAKSDDDAADEDKTAGEDESLSPSSAG